MPFLFVENQKLIKGALDYGRSQVQIPETHQVFASPLNDTRIMKSVPDYIHKDHKDDIICDIDETLPNSLVIN